jgi:hypothetical protein
VGNSEFSDDLPPDQNKIVLTKRDLESEFRDQNGQGRQRDLESDGVKGVQIAFGNPSKNDGIRHDFFRHAENRPNNPSPTSPSVCSSAISVDTQVKVTYSIFFR